jgi:uncharacterized protein
VLVVADSSPLIYLSRVGVLHVLVDLFEEVVVPQAVWDEIVTRRPDAPGADALRHATWIRVAENPATDVNLGLDAGETAAILLAEISRADLLLIDERVGRSIARRRSVEVRGTLGVLVLARQSDVLPAVKPVLDALVAEGFRIAPTLVREVLAAVGEGPTAEGSRSRERS